MAITTGITIAVIMISTAKIFAILIAIVVNLVYGPPTHKG